MVTNPSDRKKRERFLLDRFLSIAKIDALVQEEGEAPDFGILYEGRRVGVEITELFAQSAAGQLPLQAHESLSARIVAAARQAYEAAGGVPVHLSVSFFPGVDLRSVHRDTVAKALAAVVQELSPIRGQHVLWRNDYSDEDLSAISLINVLGQSAAEFSHWGVAAAGWVAPLTKELLQQSISEKNTNIVEYRKRYDEVWLVIATIGNQPSQFLDKSGLSDPTEVHSLFDRTYYCSSFASELIPLGAA